VLKELFDHDPAQRCPFIFTAAKSVT